MRRGWIIAGALILAAVPSVPVAAAGVSLVLERVNGGSDQLGKWVRTGDVQRFRVRLSGAAKGARVAIAVSPVAALSDVICVPVQESSGLGPSSGALKAAGTASGAGGGAPVLAGPVAVPGALQAGGTAPTTHAPATGGAQASAKSWTSGALPTGGGGTTTRVGPAAAEALAVRALSDAGILREADALRDAQGSGGAGAVSAAGSTGGAGSSTGIGPTGAAGPSGGVRSSGGIGPSGAAGSTTGGVESSAAGGAVLNGVRVCTLGDVAGQRTMDVTLTVPAGAGKLALAAVARTRATMGTGEITTTRTATFRIVDGVATIDAARLPGRGHGVAGRPHGRVTHAASATPAVPETGAGARGRHTPSTEDSTITVSETVTVHAGGSESAKGRVRGGEATTDGEGVTGPAGGGEAATVRGGGADGVATGRDGGSATGRGRGGEVATGRVQGGGAKARPGAVGGGSGSEGEAAPAPTPAATGFGLPVVPQAFPTIPSVIPNIPAPTSATGLSTAQPFPSATPTPLDAGGAVPLPWEMTSSAKRVQPVRAESAVSGLKGFPLVAGGIAALLGPLWLIGTVQRGRNRKKVL
ncbi:hypothetical protein ABZ897_40645 [Nonomuraea sp. NPDC046802]|uniref:hypothetical protein n=1 Tax=Nonomuraea sp. NPDC046802 TaxID=3154919 RepID=UPI003407F99D